VVANTVAQSSIIGHHRPFRCPAGFREEAENEIVSAGGSRVQNSESAEVFGIGRSLGRRPIKHNYEGHTPVADDAERPAPYTFTILLATRQAVEEVVAVNNDRHTG
jgi:hypothetical protein